MSRNLTGGIKLQNCHKSVSVEAAGLWMLLITFHSRSQAFMGEAVHTSRVWPVSTWDQKEKFLPAVMSRQCPLLTKLKIVPVGKRRIFKGSRSIFTGWGWSTGFCSTVFTVLAGEGHCLSCISAEHRWLTWLLPPVFIVSSGMGEWSSFFVIFF